MSLNDFMGVLCFPFLVLETSCHCLFPQVQLLNPSSAMFTILLCALPHRVTQHVVRIHLLDKYCVHMLLESW